MKLATCVVEVGGAPEYKPYKVKVSVQKLGGWWRWVPWPSYKKVAVFGFHWEELWHPRQAYTSLPADIDVGRLQKACATSGDALVKIVVKDTYGKSVTTTPVAEFVRRLGEEEPAGFVLQLSVEGEHYKNTKAQQDQQEDKSEGVQGQRNADSRGSEGQGKAQDNTPGEVTCPSCKIELPFGLVKKECDWDPLAVEPPTVMDTYVDLLAAECTIMKKEGYMLLRGKRSYMSELAALQAEMDRMEREMDRAEASWASTLMAEAESSEDLLQDNLFTTTE